MNERPIDSEEAKRIRAFLEAIGIGVDLAPLETDGFLPALQIRAGRLIVDPDRLQWIGDLLHEAGHIAVTDPALRPTLDTPSDDPGEEMAAIAWSWAAAKAIHLDAAILFHEGGYRGGASALIENFAAGRYVGMPMLHYFGMSIEPRQARDPSEAYPNMLRWLR